MISPLEDLLARLGEKLPYLSGQVRQTDNYDSHDNQLDMQTCFSSLLAYWQQAHPEAGLAYWRCRSWGMLVWQPAYLSVLSVHLGGALPQLDSLQQKLDTGVTTAFSLLGHSPQQGNEQELIAEAGQQWQQYRQRWLNLLHPAPLPEKLAAMLLADCLLSALLLLPDYLPDWDAQRVRQAADAWLTACNLQHCSGLLQIKLDRGQVRMALNRRGCCQHFRRHDGDYCSSCPRRPLSQRLFLLQQELQPELQLRPEPEHQPELQLQPQPEITPSVATLLIDSDEPRHVSTF